MAPRLTDKQAIRIALLVARDTEESLVDAHRDHLTREVDESEQGVRIARRRIKAFERVLDRYYPGWRDDESRIEKGRPVSIFRLMQSAGDDGWMSPIAPPADPA